MKKLLTLIVIAILCLTTTVGCGGATNSSFTGTHWLTQPTFRGVEVGFYERIEYTVTSELTPEEVPTLYPEPGSSLVFTVSEGSTFVAELYEEDGLYVYKTELTISGTYKYQDKAVTVTNDFTKTETRFKGLENGFAPVSAKKQVKNSFPKDVSLSEVITFAYDSSIDYQESNAIVKVTPKDSVSASHLTAVKDQVTVSKYNKKTYVDNDMMPLLLRNFKYENSLSYTFSSIEDITGTLKGCKASAYVTSQTAESSTVNTAIRPMTINDCSIANGGRYDMKFDACGIKFSTTGEFSQDFLYAYYANAIHDNPSLSSRHYMIKCYRPAIYNSAYIVYTLSTVSYEKN